MPHAVHEEEWLMGFGAVNPQTIRLFQALQQESRRSPALWAGFFTITGNFDTSSAQNGWISNIAAHAVRTLV
jgi:hypothetical protein